MAMCTATCGWPETFLFDSCFYSILLLPPPSTTPPPPSNLFYSLRLHHGGVAKAALAHTQHVQITLHTIMPHLCEPHLCEPHLCEPHLCEPHLCEPHLCECKRSLRLLGARGRSELGEGRHEGVGRAVLAVVEVKRRFPPPEVVFHYSCSC